MLIHMAERGMNLKVICFHRDLLIFSYFCFEEPVRLVVSKSIIVLCEYEITVFLKDISESLLWYCVISRSSCIRE